MIYIDFVGGAHGNYLEFVCNRILANVITAESTPFNKLGASHQKIYLSEKMFECGHFFSSSTKLVDSCIISIQFKPEDLLALQCVSLLRAGDYNVDPQDLEINTYHKLDTEHYRWMRQNLVSQYFDNQIVNSYRAVADSSWPQISTSREYFQLPNHIQQECEQVHGLRLYQFDTRHPDCPRHVLREFFRIGFLLPEQHGLVLNQNQMKYNQSCNVYKFEFGKFYSLSSFVTELERIAEWLDLKVDIHHTDVVDLHQKFLDRQPFKHSKQQCDDLIARILAGDSFELPRLNVIYEGYIDARLEQLFGRTMPINEQSWYTHSSQIKS